MKNLALLLLLSLALLPFKGESASMTTPPNDLSAYTLGELAAHSPMTWADHLDRPLTRPERRLVRRAQRIVKRHPDQATIRASESLPLDAFAVGGFLLGILSIVTIPLMGYSALFLGLLGLTFSLIGMRRTRVGAAHRGRIWATLGVIASVINLAVFTFLFTIMALIVI